VINRNAQAVNMVNVQCLGCVLAILVGLVLTVPFVKSDLTANMDDVLMNHLNANATASTMGQLVINQCVPRVVILNMVIAMYLNNVGASLDGLAKTALFVNHTGAVFMELALTIPGSASVKKDGWDLTAIAQKILMAIGVNGVNGVSVLAVLAGDNAPDHVIFQLQLAMELTALMMEVHAMNLKSVMWLTIWTAQISPMVTNSFHKEGILGTDKLD